MYASTNGKYTIFVDYDHAPMSPRYFDNVGTMTCWHNRYLLGDRNEYEGPEDFYLDLYERTFHRGCDDWKKARSELVQTPGFIIMPLYLFDHSGLAIQTKPFNDPWDSGLVGYVYCLPETVKREFGSLDDDAIESARKCINAEVETYDHYLRGEVYSYDLYEGIDCVDSVSGFIAFYDQAIEDMKSCIPEEAEGLLDQLEDINDMEPDSYLLSKIGEGVIKCPV